MRPHRRGYPVASDTGFTKAVSVLKKGGTNTEIHRNVGTAQFGGGTDVHTRLKLLFPIGLRGEVRDYYTLKTPPSAFRFSAEDSTMSSSRQDWSFTFRRLRREGR